MPKRSSKKPDAAPPPEPTEQPAAEAAPTTKQPAAKNPAAVELGRRGGLKGGPARAKKLSKEQLSEIGKKAAAARWKKKRS